MQELFIKLGSRNTRFITYSIITLIFITLIFYGKIQYADTRIIDLIEEKSEKYVSVNGSICSEPIYKEFKNTYQIFSLCDEYKNNITVWRYLNKSSDIELKLNDKVKINGLFTTKYEEPEITYIKKIEKISG